ncbi:MAG TPA: MFS transporter [Opitutus sp.]|nr:MFS transporter [Opitutus sp.]
MNDPKLYRPVASLIVLTGLNLLDYLDRQLLAAVLTPIKNELALTDEQLGTLQSAFMWGYFLTSPIFGHLGDRVPRRWLVAAGVLVWSLGTLMTGHVSALAALIFFRVLVGLGEASFGTLSPGWIADLFPGARRNTAISIFYLAIPVGSALGYIIGSALAARYGWRAACLWAGYPGLLLAFVLFLLREPPRERAPQAAVEEPAPGAWSAYAALVRHPGYVLVVAGYIAQTFAMGGFALWAPTFLHRVHGFDYESAGRFFGLSLVLTGIAATLGGGLVATAWQRRSPAGYSSMLALSASVAVPVAFAAFLLEDPFMARVALVGAMFFLFVPTGPVNTLILETVPPHLRARAMAGSIFAIHALGDLWSPWIVGRLSDHWGSLRPAVLILPFALGGSAAFWIWLMVRQRRAARAAK